MNVLILDGDLKSALSAVRSLGGRGMRVIVGAARPTGMALHSTYADETFVYPSPYVDRRAFIDAVLSAAAGSDERPVVYAFSDATYLTLFDHRRELEEHVTLVFPEERSVEIAFDKAATHSEARVLGVPVILTHTPERREEVARLAAGLTYPAVVKARHSVAWKEGEGVFGSATFVHDAGELERVFFELHGKTGEYPVVQPYIRGEEYGVEVLADGGVIRALCAHHRIRSLSPTGGASVLKETLGEDSELARTMIEHTTKLIKALNWHGPMMAEWKVESDAREPLLMEQNGRFWGSLPLSIAAGVDFPYLYYQLARGELGEIGAVTARPEVTTQHYLGDVLHLARVFFGRDRMRSRAYPKRLKALRDFLILPRGTKSDVWSLRDPKPGIMEYIDVFARRRSN